MATTKRLAEQVGEQCRRHPVMLAVAESCTAGGIAYAITSVPGSSSYFDRGFVTYSNQAKQEMLGVPVALLEQYGAVSEEVATAMAVGALKCSGASIVLAITGIAGPDGGSVDKPVGYVWFALAAKNRSNKAACHYFSGDRHSIREQAIEFALQLLLDYIM